MSIGHGVVVDPVVAGEDKTVVVTGGEAVDVTTVVAPGVVAIQI